MSNTVNTSALVGQNDAVDDGEEVSTGTTALSASFQQPQDLLMLFLGLNELQQPLPNSFEFLTTQELLNVRTVSKSIYNQMKTIPYLQCRDGRDYFVPFPGFPGLLSTPTDQQVGAGLFAHQLASLRQMHSLENSTHHFGGLRGGILGDAPGLGKSITILALISSTAGQRPTNPPEFWDTSNLEEGWQAVRLNPVAAVDVYATIKPIHLWMDTHRRGRYYNRQFQEMRSNVSPPYADPNHLPTIDSFERYVKRTLLQKCGVPRSVLELFRAQMVQFKAGLDKRNRKLLKQQSQSRRIQQERRLLPSSATLIVVPDALLEHWYQQITQHLDLTRFTDDGKRRGVVYLDGIGDLQDARIPLRNIQFNQHDPTSKLPSVPEMSQYHIVITCFSRCEAEYKRLVDAGHLTEVNNGSDSQANNRKSKRSRRSKRSRPTAPIAVQGSDSSLALLLQIRWLRLVVDEGHELGTHEAGSNVTRFIHEIAAERRWVASGTPTTGNEDDQQFTGKALDQLQRLLMFLRHPTYGDIPSNDAFTNNDDAESKQLERKVQAKQQWELRVKDPFLKKDIAGREELEKVLKEIMVMHRKEDIHLPKPVFEQADVEVPIPEDVQRKVQKFTVPAMATAYFDEYLHSSEYQTLVDQAQARYIIDKIRQARESLLARGGPLVESQKGVSDYSLLDPSSEDRRPIKAVVYSSNSNVLLSVTDQLYRNLSFENIAELYGNAKIGDLGMELSRFRHGFKEQRVCPVCHRENDIVYKGSQITRCQQTLLEVMITDELALAEGQPCRFLIEPERIVSTVDVPVERMSEETLASYSKSPKFWRVGDTLMVDVRNPHPVLACRESEETWADWGSEECKEHAYHDRYAGPDWYMGPLPEGQDGTFRVRLEKWQKCGNFLGTWFSGPRFIDMPIEKVDEDVFILALDASLATGLDLSFCTHMFLLEAIDDAAMLEQVTSRAHRLGATGPVVIDTVNTFWKLPRVTEKALEETAGSSTGGTSVASPTKQLERDKEQTLSKVVCSFCYRQFESMAKAEEHERLTCQRNPASAGISDPFHLSSIYESIRPPPALETNCR